MATLTGWLRSGAVGLCWVGVFAGYVWQAAHSEVQAAAPETSRASKQQSADATALTPRQAAAQLDRLLAEELALTAQQRVDRVDDATYLRRLTLDLLGRNPTPEELTAFEFDAAKTKRPATIRRLLNQPAYGENWARYWRDVILSRRNDQRALLASQSTTSYLTEKFNSGAGWDQIAREFVTAQGDLEADGATALLASQFGQIPDTAAEVSRVLLGIQIQCAQCHDHPTDRWQREEFHELAAFFPRVGVRPIRDGEQRRGFEVVARDFGRNQRVANNERGPVAEHRMPDMDNPAEPGPVMQPKFFLTGQELQPGSPDETRRDQLAEWIITAEGNWFAKAYVNRLWSEMCGEGFYEPVDDIGPDREATAPRALDYLAEQFVANGHDTRWLLATIAQTELYALEARPRRQVNESPFAANCARRLRTDEIFTNLVEGLEIDTTAPRQRTRRPTRGPSTLREQWAQVFGYDPSLPRGEVAGAIPQALLLMNSPVLNQALSAENRGTLLGSLLETMPDDRALTQELYLRLLGRLPTENEVSTCLGYLPEAGSRAEAFEDIAWALVNSTEFLYRE